MSYLLFSWCIWKQLHNFLPIPFIIQSFLLIWTSPFFQWAWTGEIYSLVQVFTRTQMLSNFFSSSLFDIFELQHMCSGRMSQHRCSSQKILGQIPWVNCSHEGNIEFWLDYGTRSQETWRWFLTLLMTPFLIKAQPCCAFVFLEKVIFLCAFWSRLRFIKDFELT